MNEQSTFAVRVECERCGNVRVAGTELTLRVAHHDGSAEVRFSCPDCRWIQFQPVDDGQATALVAAGVAIEWWQLPADLHQAHVDPSFEETDIDHFVDFLYDDVALRLATERLFATEQPAPRNA